MKNVLSKTTKIAIFQKKEIRKVILNDEWWFSVVDVCSVLTESKNPQVYWRVLKKRLIDEGYFQYVTNCNVLKLESSDGKKYKTDCANTQGILRIIQSIPSPKAEPFKRWLAKVGYERVQEIENPELAIKRTRNLYKAKGYSDDWIDKRMRGIKVRETLTNEWSNRNVGGGLEYSILTSEISKATFDMTPSQYKKHKGLKRENLRDHMNDLELIFSMLGEASTTEITRNRDAQGFEENKVTAQKGGEIAGVARKKLEVVLGEKISSTHNYLKIGGQKKL